MLQIKEAIIDQPTLSVITVVRNCKKHIERTILSVINQTYPSIEYIIVDGCSTDGTLAIIKNYQGKISQFISEQDAGIYDAMNKGLAMAIGDYLLFLNAGDEIYNSGTVERIFAHTANADIYYGETEIIDQQLNSLGRRRRKAPKKFTRHCFKLGMSICHQALYVKRSLAGPYDLSYQLASDFDWAIRIAKKTKHAVNVHEYVAKFLFGGLSKKRCLHTVVEQFKIMNKHYGLFPTVFVTAYRLAWCLKAFMLQRFRIHSKAKAMIKIIDPINEMRSPI